MLQEFSQYYIWIQNITSNSIVDIDFSLLNLYIRMFSNFVKSLY